MYYLYYNNISKRKKVNENVNIDNKDKSHYHTRKRPRCMRAQTHR